MAERTGSPQDAHFGARAARAVLCAYRSERGVTLEWQAGAEPVTLFLGEGVRLARSAGGEWLFYRNYGSYGRRLAEALESRWCRVYGGTEMDGPPEDGVDRFPDQA